MHIYKALLLSSLIHDTLTHPSLPLTPTHLLLQPPHRHRVSQQIQQRNIPPKTRKQPIPQLGRNHAIDAILIDRRPLIHFIQRHIQQP